MPAYYQAALATFTSDDAASVLWKLTQANAQAQFPLTPEAMEAWRAQLPILTTAANHLLKVFPNSQQWGILLEYPIPIVGKRIDAVLLVGDLIIVLETKTGVAPTSAARQVDDYALNLACFHEHSERKIIVPVVVSNAPVVRNTVSTEFDMLIEQCRFSSAQNLGEALETICTQYAQPNNKQADLEEWNRGRFKPIPPIIEAAVALYSEMDVFEIGHACAAREDLDKTTNALIATVLEAQAQHKKVICFTTGVPGAGKTLVGLNTVHRPEIKNFASFLSGNGPLVKVIQEALIRDVVNRSRSQEQRVTRRQAEIEVQAFVHNVHRFADQYYGEGHQQPVQKVIVFDEAQRAWDNEQNERAKRPKVSEATMMLDVMNRHTDWAVIIALIGGGQEINRGEAGLSEWGRALAAFPDWGVYASPYVLSGDGMAGFRLFDIADSHPERIIPSSALHLNVCTRSIRAQQMSDWVNEVLSGKQERAKIVSENLEVKPFLTRNLTTAKAWLNSNRRGRTRAGLVTSATANRLRADGLEPTFDFHQRFDWEHWFLDTHDCAGLDCDHKYCNDVRASSKLEVAATQFEIQGLELDWVGLCWGEDLSWDGEQWVGRRFNNKIWKLINPDDPNRKMYLINAYRVLLTRARQGMVIYIPSPSQEDKSRLPKDLDMTAEFLLNCGTQALEI